jgi:enterochelin esterase-like enzyme
MRLLRFLGFFTLLSAPLSALDVQVKLAASAASTPVDGRVIVILSKDMDGEPRSQVGWGIDTAQIFGLDVNGWKTGDTAHFDGNVFGNPLRNLHDIPPGMYNLQAVLNVYETFRRADGHVVKLHMDHGEGQQWNRSPGNLYSKPKRVEIGANTSVAIELTEVIPPIAPPKDTKYVRHVSIESKLLTKFWGRPMRIGAIVLVPEGFDDHPQQRYPVAYQQGHFAGDFFRFRETPPNAEMKGGERRTAEAGYLLYQEWTSGRLPRMLVVVTQHPTPYYDDSYGVNTANAGPYGDALTQELYPQVERQFRAIGEEWARVVFGGSTGGWMTLAQQIFYPDYFGGAWGFCPDPVDFHAFQSINVYSDKNAYFDQGPFARLPKLLGRLPNDHILSTMEQFSQQEFVLGTQGRSGGQMDAFHATFGPVDAAGYPDKLWDAESGGIHPDVARYWEEHYDLTALLMRDWTRLGPKLIGKLHVTMGTKDTFYLDAAAHRMENFLESTKLPGKGPYYGGSFEFGNNEPHCYAGKIPEGVSIFAFYLPIFAEHMRTMAPKGADVESWRK